MNVRKIVMSALLLAAGFVIHQIVPPFAGVTFDIQLAMLFVILLINPDFKSILTVSSASGIITAITTKFPGGQIPNIIDKLVTGLLMYLLLKAFCKISNKYITAALMGALGTVISGSVFLSSALLLVGLPSPFMTLFLAVVAPTAIANTVITPLLYSLVVFSMKAAGFRLDNAKSL